MVALWFCSVICQHGQHVVDVHIPPFENFIFCSNVFPEDKFMYVHGAELRDGSTCRLLKLVLYNWLIKNLLIAEVWMMVTEDMDTLALAFFSLLFTGKQKTEPKWNQSLSENILTGATFQALNFNLEYWQPIRIVTFLKFNTHCVCTIFSLLEKQIGQGLVVSQDFRRQGLTCSSLKVRVCCSPESLQPLIDMSSLLSSAGANTPQNICSQTALAEPYWHRTRTPPPNSQAGARWRPALLLPLLHVPDKSWGRMACRYRPRQACATHRWPPSGGFQCSLLSKDKLSNRLLFYEFTLRSISQKRLRKILGLSCSTLRQTSILWKVTRPG